MRTIFAAGVLAAVAVVAFSGCGGSKKNEETPATWTNSLCSSLVTWQDSIKSAGNKFHSGNISKSTLQDAKSTVSSANSKLKDDLKSLGKPPTQGASEARSSVSSLESSLKSNIDDIQNALSGVSSVQDIGTAVSAIGTSVSAMGSAFASTTSQLQSLADSDPWKKAFQQSEACQKLKSG